MLARKSLKCLFSLFVCVCLFSCKNYYDGEQFQNQLEQSIAYANAKQAKVTVSKVSNDDTAVLEPVGRLTSERVGYPFSISYTPCSTYTFVKWAALKDDGTEFSAEEVLFEDSSAMETNVTVNTEEQVTIQAVSAPKSKLTLSFDIPNYPYDKRSYEESESFNLSWQDFTANYAFLGWQVYDTATNQIFNDYEEYLTFGNILSGNTEVTVHKIGKMLTIRGIIQQYPKIISATPINENGGVSKETPIRVRFNQPLSSETLYYESESELPEGATPLKATIDGKEELYGYIGGGQYCCI